MAKRRKQPLPMTALDLFSASFASEDALRKEVIALFELMPGIENVHDTQGKLEVGIDVIFETYEPLRGQIVHGCVLKRDKIIGSAEKKSGARTVFNQAQQSLDTERSKRSDASRIKVQNVHIISPFECSEEAILSVRGALEKSDHVRFLCGRDLYELFDKHYPEYLSLHASGLERIAGTVIAALDNDKSVQEALRLHGFLGLPNSPGSFYIPPNFAKFFHSFSLSFVVPDIQQLDRALNRAQVNEFCRRLLFGASVLAKLSSSTDSNDPLPRQANQIASDLKNAWETGFAKKWETWRVKRDSAMEKRGNVTDKKLENFRLPEPVRSSETLALEMDDSVRSEVSALVSSFVRSIRSINKKIAAANGVTKAIPSLSKSEDWSSVAISQPYAGIEMASFLYQGTIVRDRKPTTSIPLTSDRMEKLTSNLLISGPPGMGKTSFCKWSVIEGIKKLQDGATTTIPIYVPVYHLRNRDLIAFEDTFFIDQQMKDLWRSRRSRNLNFRLFLDGLDEVADIEFQQKIVELALREKRSNAFLSIVVTARDYVGVPALEQFVRVSIEQFDDPQLELFISGWFKADAEGERTFREQLKLAPDLLQLMRVPLLGTLIVKVQRSTKSPLPSSRMQLYQMFVGLLAGGWDFAKQVNRGSRFGQELKVVILAHLADGLHERRKREFSNGDFRNSVKHVFPSRVADSDEIMQEIGRDGLIVSEAGTWGFVHHSFQEYLAATFLIELGGERARQVFRRYLSGDDWWAEVAKFAVAISKNPASTVAYIRKTEDYLFSRKQDVIVKPRVKELLGALELAYSG